MAKYASLTSGLVMKGKSAVPKKNIKVESDNNAGDVQYFKALTVKLDKARYLALKEYGLKEDLKSQKIFIQALDKFLNLKTT